MRRDIVLAGPTASFACRDVRRTTRYDVPLLHARKVILDDMPEGGVDGNLDLASHGTSQSLRPLMGAGHNQADRVIEPAGAGTATG